MKVLPIILLHVFLVSFAFGQNEQSPIVEKDFAYKDWTYKNIKSDGKTNLREFTKGNKLVLVVYWAPWCHNWEHDVDFVETLYKKYKDSGLAIIGVGEYDTVGKMKAHIDEKKLTFPLVYESDNSGQRLKTMHFSQRTEAGDARRWGSPWYIFLEPELLEPSGEFLTRKTTVVNGELIKPDAERFIREKLGLKPEAVSLLGRKGRIEISEPGEVASRIVKP